MTAVIPVTCAIILHENKVLCAQRSETMPLPLKWEFPGGKLEAGEDAETCLKREIQEELSIEIEVHEHFLTNRHSYQPGKEIQLISFLCSWNSGKLNLKEHLQVVWFGPQDLSTLEWAEADVPIVKKLIVYLQTTSEEGLV